MLAKVRNFSRALRSWTHRASSEIDLDLLKRAVELQERQLSPIDRHILYSNMLDRKGLFHSSYDFWRVKRFDKLLEIYGIPYFKGRRILELGAGHGDIGAFFAELGAEVLCLDGRIQNVNFASLKHRKIPNIRFEQQNLEHDFSRFGRFDLIINFGLIYHLQNVDEHLKCCFSMADDMVLETVVCDSTDPQKIFFCKGKPERDEEALEGTGSRPSPFYVERIGEENGFEVVRYFTSDLNSGEQSPNGYQFRYDWEHKNDDGYSAHFDGPDLRRFWRFRKR
jgi:2-polyprenyl-3-methyl-5-hydroxy-6-metoxy-1,4-benzoquinol methylase